MTAQPVKLSKLTSQLRFRLTAEERAVLEREAKTARMTLSDLARERVTKGRRPAPRTRTPKASSGGFQAMDPALFAELARIGNNLNQLTRAFNSGQDLNRAEVLQLVAKAWQTMLTDEVTARYVTMAESKVKAGAQPR